MLVLLSAFLMCLKLKNLKTMGGAHNTAKLFQQLQYIHMTLSLRNALHTKIKEDMNNILPISHLGI